MLSRGFIIGAADALSISTGLVFAGIDVVVATVATDDNGAASTTTVLPPPLVELLPLNGVIFSADNADVVSFVEDDDDKDLCSWMTFTVPRPVAPPRDEA
jgi:hypothetical protein